jgi:EF-hand domain pair
MLPALALASSAVDAIKSLTSSRSPSAQPAGGFGQFDIFGSTDSPGATAASAPGGGSQISPATMSALLTAQSQASTGTTTPAPASRSAALQDLFSQIDADGDGQISKSEFEGALGAGGTNLAQADDVFSKLDKDGSGSVSLDEMTSALKGSGGKGHHHAHGAGGSGGGKGGSGIESLMQALQATSSTSVTNSDGSTTTSLTYADGSTVTMTSAAATSSAATSSYNFIEQMIQREAKAVSFSAASLSVSA